MSSAKKRRIGDTDHETSNNISTNAQRYNGDTSAFLDNNIYGSNYESENEESGEDIEGDAEDKWTEIGELARFLFNATSRLKTQSKRSHPCEFFELLFDKTFYSNIVQEVNKNGSSKVGDRWKEVTIAEFKKFFGLLLHMGTIKCHHLLDYWSTQRLFDFKCFSQHMSEDRFYEILQSLYYSSESENPNRNVHHHNPGSILNKIQPSIDYFNAKMNQVYYPPQELCMARTMNPSKGKLTFQERISGQRLERSIGFYYLADNSGIVLRIAVQEVNDDSDKKEDATAIALRLLEDFLYKGHSVYMDDFYTSFDLSKRLLVGATYCTGNVQKFREGNSREVSKIPLAQGEMIYGYKNNIVMSKFKNNEEYLIMSSEFEPIFLKLENKANQNYSLPIGLHKYNVAMEGIQNKERLQTDYTSIKESFKWYVKLWVNIIETMVLNTFFLYLKYSHAENKLYFHNFRLDIIDNLLFEKNEDEVFIKEELDLPEDKVSVKEQWEHPMEDNVFIKEQSERKREIKKPINQQLEHTLEMLPRDAKGRIRRKRCRQCFSRGIRINTNYCCAGCEGSPGLCLGQCFKEFHRRNKLWFHKRY